VIEKVYCLVDNTIMNSIAFAAIMPHPPIILPEIGKEQLKKAEKTKAALEALAARIKAEKLDTLIVITPHGETGQAGVPVYTAHVFEGNFGAFGYPKISFSLKGNPKLALSLVKKAQDKGAGVFSTSETLLDHGVLVPLYYPIKAGFKGNIVPIGIAFQKLSSLFNFGKVLGEAISASETLPGGSGKVGIIASSDMSHRLTKDSPSGYHPSGKTFDDKLVSLVSANDVKGILNFDEDLAEEAGQDALWSIAILLGALDGTGKKANVLSYEGPYGVGYLVADFQ
jgi:aromatic ring-opening dioxygenase LigB subunit